MLSRLILPFALPLLLTSIFLPTDRAMAITWHSEDFTDNAAGVSNIDVAITTRGLRVIPFVRTVTSAGGDISRSLGLITLDREGRRRVSTAAARYPLLNTAFTSLNNGTRIATRGGRTWLAWGDASPRQILLIEVPEDPMSLVWSEAVAVTNSAAAGIDFDLAVGDDGLPRLAFSLNSATGLEIRQAYEMPDGALGFSSHTAFSGGGYVYTNGAIGARGGRQYWCAERRSGNGRELILREATEVADASGAVTLNAGTIQVVSANASSTSALTGRMRLAVSATGSVAIIYKDLISNTGALARRDPALGWGVTLLGTSGAAEYLDAECDGGEELHLAWRGNSSTLRYARTGIRSGNLGAETASGLDGLHASLALDGLGNPTVATTDETIVNVFLPLDTTDLNQDGFTALETEARLDRRVSPAQPPGPVVSLDTVSGATYPHITFETVTGGQTLGTSGYFTANLLYQVERSTDGRTWSAAGVTSGDTFTVSGRRIASYRSTVSVQAAPRQFLRVRVARP